MRTLPPPETVADHYLAAIHDVLGDIRDRLPAACGQPAQPGGPVEVREPATPPAAPPAPARPVPVQEPVRPARKPSTRKPPARTKHKET